MNKKFRTNIVHVFWKKVDGVFRVDVEMIQNIARKLLTRAPIYNVAKFWVKNREVILTQNVATLCIKNRLRFLHQNALESIGSSRRLGPATA